MCDQNKLCMIRSDALFHVCGLLGSQLKLKFPPLFLHPGINVIFLPASEPIRRRLARRRQLFHFVIEIIVKVIAVKFHSKKNVVKLFHAPENFIRIDVARLDDVTGGIMRNQLRKVRDRLLVVIVRSGEEVCRCFGQPHLLSSKQGSILLFEVFILPFQGFDGGLQRGDFVVPLLVCFTHRNVLLVLRDLSRPGTALDVVCALHFCARPYPPRQATFAEIRDLVGSDFAPVDWTLVPNCEGLEDAFATKDVFAGRHHRFGREAQANGTHEVFGDVLGVDRDGRHQL